MSSVMVDKLTLLRGGALPPQLEGCLTQNEYYTLCNSYQECEAEAQCLACACETCICLFTGFFCIYCAHPFVTVGAVDYTMKERINSLNYAFYGGRPVMSITGVGSIAFSLPVLDEVRPRQATAEVYEVPRSDAQEPAKAIVVTDSSEVDVMMQAEPVDSGYQYDEDHQSASASPSKSYHKLDQQEESKASAPYESHTSHEVARNDAEHSTQSSTDVNKANNVDK